MHTKLLIIGAALLATPPPSMPRAPRGAGDDPGLQPGGQLTITTDVENWPGDIAVMGPDLMERMRAQAEHLGVRMVGDVVTSVDLSRRPFVVALDGGETWTADMLGSPPRQRALAGPANETKLRGHGVSACATCDGFFFRGKEVAVVGGGNSAVEEAMFLTNFAKRVHLCTAAMACAPIAPTNAACSRTPRWSCTGTRPWPTCWRPTTAWACAASRCWTRRPATPASCPSTGCFVAIGTRPRDVAVPRPAGHGRGGYIRVTPGTTATSVPGVFAAGDVTDRCTGRRSRPRGRAAWRRWMRTVPAHAHIANQSPRRRSRCPFDWDKLRLFHTVASAGSLTEGARRLHTVAAGALAAGAIP
jgi:thioredoxin reductase (NADPH)